MTDNDAELDFGAFLLGVVVGGAVGAAMGLLFAPQSGEETRMMIRDKGWIATRSAVGGGNAEPPRDGSRRQDEGRDLQKKGGSVEEQKNDWTQRWKQPGATPNQRT
jgi:gas vesicle protein